MPEYINLILKSIIWIPWLAFIWKTSTTAW